jgi:hypothetical protein
MADKDQGALSPEELEGQDAEALPGKEAMSVIDAKIGMPVDNFVLAVNEASALNVASTSSVAVADADQIINIDQTSEG